MLTAPKEKEGFFIQETKSILDATAMIDEKHLEEILSIVNKFFLEADYIDRLKQYSEGVARRAASYGLLIDQDNCQFELANGAYYANVKNLLQDARKFFFMELQLYISIRAQKMGFSSLMTDTVTLLKKDGSIFDGIKASVQKSKIFIINFEELVESGDLIRRKMSNGGEETFEVIDPGFHEMFGSIPANYQMTVKKLGIPEAKTAVQNITYNIAGNNARINQNSIDNSTNVVTVNPDVVECISALRNVIQTAEISDFEKKFAKDVIDAVDAQLRV